MNDYGHEAHHFGDTPRPSQFVVSWDGPEAGKRAYQVWTSRENAEAHYRRKLAAGLNPEVYDEADLDDIIAAQQLEKDQH